MKYKKIPKSYIKICVDRLTRFKPPCEKYERVFKDIINKFLISDSTSKKEVLGQDELCDKVLEIFNSSIPYDYDPFISEIIQKEEQETYALNKEDLNFIETKLNLTGAIKFISDEPILPLNLKRLCVLEKTRSKDINFLREKYSLLYPVELIVLTEGATEEILLSRFAEKLGFNFNKNGVIVLGAGGKNQVARKYYKMTEEIKLPVFILLDCDALETKELIEPKLRPCDKIHLIKHGEFEDILPHELIINAINANFSNNLHCSNEDFDDCTKMTKNLHNLFKNKGFGEYKKAEFAKMIKNYLEHPNCGLNLESASEIKEITEEIKNMSAKSIQKLF